MLTNLLRKITGTAKGKAIILMYHRIASPQTDPWLLSVNTQNFEQQLQVLKKGYRILSVNELMDNFLKNKMEPKTICITFDDAYTDNYIYAKPLLEKYHCPATFFIPSAYIDSNQLFWWDELESITLHSEVLPSSIRILLNAETVDIRLIETTLTQEIKQKQKNWIWTDTPPTKRCELYIELWKRLRPLPYKEISAVLAEIKSWAGYKGSADTESLPMSSTSLQEMCNQSLFDIGVHTATHPALAFHSKEVQQMEIVNCRQYLEKFSGRNISSMAYPYGNYNETTLSVVQDQGFAVAFTTSAQQVTKASNPLCLGRFQALNQNRKDFDKQLRLWGK